MKVTVFDAHRFEHSTLEEAMKGKHELLLLDVRLTKTTAPLARGTRAVSLFANDDGSEEVLELLAEYGVQFIALRTAGYNHVHLEAASRLGLKVANVPEYSPYAVAEHTVAMILALNRKLIRANHRIQELNFSLDGLVGFDLHGKTLGVIGLGRIGAVVARIMHGFGCRILGYDIQTSPELVKEYGLEFVELDVLCAQADVITLHTPLTPETLHLINEERLALMKRGAMLINTSRGALVDTRAALSSLKERHLGYLGIDVYEEEAGLFFEDHSHEDLLQDDTISRLMTFKNVLITSHQGFLTTTALRNIADTTAYNLSCWEEGVETPNELTGR